MFCGTSLQVFFVPDEIQYLPMQVASCVIFWFLYYISMPCSCYGLFELQGGHTLCTHAALALKLTVQPMHKLHSGLHLRIVRTIVCLDIPISFEVHVQCS